MPTHNRLQSETSPYLQQHADNPVDWYPWGEEALTLARRENKPILLSIGYSACHWCHVMAHESFEDAETARLMNELFVNIKVDREERPDLDKVYQLVHQLLRRGPGGWPLTVFLSPDDLRPFFAGTYFPPEPRHGLPGFPELLQRLESAWRTQPDAIREHGEALQQILEQVTRVAPHEGMLSEEPLFMARDQLQASFDSQDGGFSDAPKFPHAELLEFLLDHARRDDDTQTRHMAAFTLERMARGGLFDQLGGGFYRYSVDRRWMIPHFEKMLYDNGPLLALYARAGRELSAASFERIARRTADWVLTEMRSPEGAFFSSLDADSEGTEGKYYVWPREEMETVLTPEEFVVAERAWGLDQPPNFENRSWHLYRAHGDAELAASLKLDPGQPSERLASARRRLLEARERRVRPGLDDKVLTAWNALMIRGLAIAGRVLDEPRYVEAAGDALAFLRTSAWQDGRLYATWKNGEPRLNAYLDDYAFLLDAALELLQCRWEDADFAFAVSLADGLLERFADPDGAGFFFTSHDHETLIQRPRPFADEATPSGNGIAALALQRLGHLSGDPRCQEAATLTLRAAWADLTRAPAGHSSLLRALAEHLEPPTIVVVRGTPEEIRDWTGALGALPPNTLRFPVPDTAADLGGTLAACRPGAGGVAYVCQGTRCSPPVTAPDELAEALTSKP